MQRCQLAAAVKESIIAGMGAMEQESSGVTMRTKCPQYPVTTALPNFATSILLNTSQLFFASIGQHPAIHAQTDALRRISFSRSRQKRGPPVFFS